MTKKIENIFKAAALLAAIGGLEFYFFHAPDLRSRLRASWKLSPVHAATLGWSGSLGRPGERHLHNIRQLTTGGQNQAPHWSFDGTQISWAGNPGNLNANQIFVMNADGSHKRMISTGKGECASSCFSPDAEWVYFAGTDSGQDEPSPDSATDSSRSEGYTRSASDRYDIFRVHPDGTGLEQMTDTVGYDAEAAVSPDGKRIVFTSTRDGDLDLYRMDPEGKHVKRLTHEPGYDGGASFSPDGKQICYSANHPQSPEGIHAYKELLAKQLVNPDHLELFVMNADGSNKRQLTNNGAANFCPVFTPDGQRLIFASNLDDPHRQNFDLYLLNLDGSGKERVTTDASFDGFAMFSPNGKKLIWTSGRSGKKPHETNLFMADWVP